MEQMGNAERKTAFEVVRLLLETNPDLVNGIDNYGHLPLLLLSKEARKISLDRTCKKKCDNILKCLDIYLSVSIQIDASAEFLNSLKGLPQWLLDHAVISKSVQKILNDKIAQRFPTFFLLFDGFLSMGMIVFFRLAIHDYIDHRVLETEKSSQFIAYLDFLYAGSFYYVNLHLVRMLSLIFLHKFSSWYTDIQNWLDMARIIMTITAVSYMRSDVEVEMEFIRHLFATTTVLLWTSMIFFLRATMIDFSVFVYSVIYIGKFMCQYIIFEFLRICTVINLFCILSSG